MKRYLLTLAVVIALTLYLINQGQFPLTGAQMLEGLLLPDAKSSFVMRELRLPPIAGAVLAGAAFGIAGLVFQRVLGNNLATPDVIGISMASGFAAVLGISMGITSSLLISAGAVLGGLVATAIVLLLSLRSSRFNFSLILNGVAIGYLATAGVNYLLSLADLRGSQQIYGWLIGTTGFASYKDLGWAILGIGLTLLALFFVRKPIHALELGEATSQSIGYAPSHWRWIALGLAVLLSSLATALVGPLAFVALTAPVLSRTLIHPYRYNYLGSATIGAGLTLGADAIHQLVFPNLGLPTGLTTGLVGAPILIYILWRGRVSGELR